MPLRDRTERVQDGAGDHPLSVSARSAARVFIEGVLREVGAELVQASLFGSRARGDARPDSDVDILLVFRWLPADREPQATHAEWLAERVADRSGIPITAWSVSLVDLERGARTPMLVDALRDSVPLWCAGAPIPRLAFTPEDGRWCTERLLTRVWEGGHEVSAHLERGDSVLAARRIRDDLVRLCTAMLLLRGVTRPRRADAARAVLQVGETHVLVREALHWAAAGFGPDGRDEAAPLPPFEGGLRQLVAAVARLRAEVEEQWRRS